MKDLIIQALNEASVILEKRTPSTKVNTIQVSIRDVNPLELLQFMKDNNIPDNAYFDGIENGYDAYDDICLSYDIDIPTTNEEKLKYNRYHFIGIAWKLIFDIHIKNGYNMVYNSALLKDSDIYNMYINKEFDRIVEYYSLKFIKI